MLSTAGHWDQSRVAVIFRTLPFIVAFYHGSAAASRGFVARLGQHQADFALPSSPTTAAVLPEKLGHAGLRHHLILWRQVRFPTHPFSRHLPAAPACLPGMKAPPYFKAS